MADLDFSGLSPVAAPHDAPEKLDFGALKPLDFSGLKPAGAADDKPSGEGAFARGAVRGVLPAAGAMVGAGAGAAMLTPLAAFTGPAAPIAAPVLGLAGAIGGGYLGADAVGHAQQALIEALPESVQETIGQSKKQQQADEESHPYASMFGNLAPQVLAMRPGAVAEAAKDAGAFERLMANRYAARLTGAGIAGGQEAAQEGLAGEDIDPGKVAIAAGTGALLNHETRLGRALTGAGARVVSPVTRFLPGEKPTAPVAPADPLTGEAPPIVPVPPPGGLPQPGDVVGLKFPNAPSQRATVDHYRNDDGVAVARVTYDGGQQQDMTLDDFSKGLTAAPPPMGNEPVRGPELKGTPRTQSDAEDWYAAEDARNIPPPMPAPTGTLGGDAINAMTRADALERAINDPNSRLTPESKAAYWQEIQALRDQFGHIPPPAGSVTPEDQARANSIQGQRDNGPLIGDAPPVDRSPTTFTPEEITAMQAARAARAASSDTLLGNAGAIPPTGPFTPEEIAAARANMGTTPNLMGQEVPNLNPAPMSLTPEQRAATAQAWADYLAKQRAAKETAQPELAPAPPASPQPPVIEPVDGRTTLMLPVPPMKGVKTLTQWVRSMGGIKDTNGDLDALYRANGKRPPPGIIANKNGQPPDVLVQRAREAGYFPEVLDDPSNPDELTSNHLLGAIEDELKGTPRYSEEDRAAVAARDEAIAKNQETRDLAGQHDVDFRGISRADFDARVDAKRMQERAAAHGIDLNGDETAAEVAALVHEREGMMDEGADADPSRDRGEREIYDRYGHDLPESRDEIPWDDYAADHAREVESQPGSPDRDAEADAQPESDRVAAAQPAGADQVATRDGEAGLQGRGASERTDQGDQFVIPGAEQSARQAAQSREVEGRGLLRPAAPQKAADEGLFGAPEPPQLFDRPPAPAPQKISWTETSRGVYRVTYDGRILGDSPGFSRDRIAAEARAIVDREERDAASDGRPAERVFEPPEPSAAEKARRHDEQFESLKQTEPDLTRAEYDQRVKSGMDTFRAFMKAPEAAPEPERPGTYTYNQHAKGIDAEGDRIAVDAMNGKIDPVDAIQQLADMVADGRMGQGLFYMFENRLNHNDVVPAKTVNDIRRDMQTRLAAYEKAHPDQFRDTSPAGWETADATVYGNPGVSRDVLGDFHDFVAEHKLSLKTPAEINEAAGNFTVVSGDQTGHEYLAAVDGNSGKVIAASTTGQEATVGIPPDLMRAMDNPGANIIAHHNHPSAGPLSGPDVQMLKHPGLSTVFAHTPDGHMSAARLSPEMREALETNPKAFANGALREIYNSARNAVFRGLMEAEDRGVIGRMDNPTLLLNRLVNESLAAGGIIDHIDTRDLTGIPGSLAYKLIEAGSDAAVARRRDFDTLFTKGTDNGDVRGSARAVQPDPGAGNLSGLGEETPGRSDAEKGSPGGRPAGPRAGEGAGSEGQAPGLKLPTIEKTEQGDQYVFPGAEKTAQQAFAARGDALTAKIKQKPANEGLFAPKTPEQGSLFEDSDQDKYRSDQAGPTIASRPEQPNTPPTAVDHIDDQARQIAEAAQQNGGSAGAPPVGIVARSNAARLPPAPAPLLTKMMGAVDRIAIMPRTLATMDWRSARFWQAWQNKDNTARSLSHGWSEDSQAYAALSKEQRAKLSAVEELDRLTGNKYSDDGRQIVARNAASPRAELSKPGKSVVLDAETTAVYHQRRAMFRDVWDTLMKSAAQKMWPKGVGDYAGQTDPAEIMKMADATASIPLRKELTYVADVMTGMRDNRNMAYVPAMRFGDYYITVKPKPGTRGAQAMNWEGNGLPPTARFELIDSNETRTTYQRIMGKQQAESARPQNAIDRVAELRKKYPEADYEISHDYLSRKPDVLNKLDVPALERMFIALNQKDSKLFGPMVEQLRNQLYRELKNGTQQRAYMVPGYSTDFGRVTGAYINWMSHYAADLQHGDAIRSAQEQYIDQHPDKAVQRYWQKWTDYQNNPAEEMTRLRQAGFYWQLAANPSSTFLVATHGPMVAHATMATGNGAAGIAAAGKHLYGAMGEALKNMRANAKVGIHVDMDRMGRTPEEKALLKEAIGTGLVHPSMEEDMRGLRQGGEDLLGVEGKTWDRALKVLSSNISSADQMNRVGTLLGTHRYMQDPKALANFAKAWQGNQVFNEAVNRGGLTPATVAKFMVDEGLFVWGKRNRAPIQRGFGAALFQFKNFEVNVLSTYLKFFTRMGPEGKIAGTLMLASLGALGGALALPFTDDVIKAADWSMEKLRGIDPMIESKLYALLESAGMSKLGAEATLRGPSRYLLGTDLNSRLGLGEPISRNMNAVDALGTVPSMMYTRFSSALNRAQHGQPLAAAADLLPTAARNVVRAAGVLPQGLQSQYGNTIVPKGGMSTADLIKSGLGFQPSNVARAYEAKEDATRLVAADDQIKSQLTGKVVDLAMKISDARAQGDSAEADRLNDQIKKIYADNPGVSISREAVTRGIQKRINPEAAMLRRTPKALRGQESPYPGVQRAAGGRVTDAAQAADRNPSRAQIVAGNYRKGHTRLHGLDITIENARGSMRRGVGADGKVWAVRMPAHYGYFKQTEGADGDHLDAYIGPALKSDRVFVVDQIDAGTGEFDEHKAMLGYRNINDALAAYRNAFSDGNGAQRVGNVRAMSIEEFKQWLRHGDTKNAIAA